MSLRKILIFIVLLIYVLIFIGTLAISIHNFRSYLIEQTKTQAQNTASTLSFALSQYADKNDTVTMNTMVDAVFETGNYQRIFIKSIKGDIIISKELKKSKNAAPNWFVNATHFNIAPASGSISSGWKQFGTVYVFSKVSLAYDQLWNNFLDIIWWFSGTFILTMLLILVSLNYLLKPLTKVKEQAENIAAKKFTIVKKLPWTLELRSAIEVMNKLSHRVQTLFEEQTQLTDKLRDQAYRDPLTKLGNRRYFSMQFEHMLGEKEIALAGALFLVEISGLESLKKEHGFEAAEEHLLKLAHILSKSEKNTNPALICRISDNTFVIVYSNISPPEATRVAKELIHEIAKLSANHKEHHKTHIGVAIYKEGQTVSQLLSQADMALRSAQTKNDFNWYMYKAEEVEKLHFHTASQWKDILTDVLQHNKVILFYQPVFSFLKNKKSILYYEILLRIEDKDGSVLPAAHFLPMAENLDLMPELDKQVIENVIKQIEQENYHNKYAINLSPSSLLDKSFCHWLKLLLSENLKAAQCIIFELPEQCAVKQLEEIKVFINDVTSLNCEVALDQFGRGFYPIHYLQTLKLSYIKIDGSFIHRIDTDPQNQFFVHTLADIAHNLEIKVVALNIENEPEFELLKTFAVDGYQGYFMGRPEDSPKV